MKTARRAQVGDLVYIPEWYCTGLLIKVGKRFNDTDAIWQVLLDTGEWDLVFESDTECVNATHENR